MRFACPLVVLLACNGDKTPVTETDPDADADADTDADADSDTDADTDADTTAPAPDWTSGPELPACNPGGSGSLVALSGVVLMPAGPVQGHVVYDPAAGRIVCAGDDCDTGGARIVCTEGVIGAAPINSHDHTQYNVLAPWRHEDLYTDRYEWQSDGRYYDYREAYDDMADANACEIVKWAELRLMIGGATSVVGSTDGSCVDVLIRNLDEDEAHGLSGYALDYSSSLRYLDRDEADDRLADLDSGAVEAILEHVAEGVDGSVRAEVDLMRGYGLVGPGNVYVHATDATTEQLAQMAIDGTGIVWSPRSNLDLYAETTLADVAKRMGVPVAIGPDWTLSGSNRVTTELQCAHDYLAARSSAITDQDLWDMVTVDASVLLGLQGRLGVLDAGAEADLAVWEWSDQPYRAVIESKYEDVRLVIVDGAARYGVPSLVDGLEAEAGLCETVTACTEDRTLCVAEGTGSPPGGPEDLMTYADLEDLLGAALAATPMTGDLAYAGELYPLWACDEERPSCDPRDPNGDDADGDGIDDGDDDCPSAWDPRQTDHDDDGRGDACDLCPLTAEADCSHDRDDIDDDGIPNQDDGCPYLADAGVPDSDEDGTSDACDACPSLPNPVGGACPLGIRAIRDPSDPNHPAEDTPVTLTDVVVIGVGTNGLFVQDPDEDEYGGIYVFGVDAQVGQLVTVAGTYVEYYGLSQIDDAVLTVQGPGNVPDPIGVDACDVGTGGPDGERYESMLLRVQGVDVTDTNPDAPADYDEFEVAGCLRVDDLLCPSCWADQPPNGTSYAELTGPLTYSFSNTKLVPREAADLIE